MTYGIILATVMLLLAIAMTKGRSGDKEPR